MGKNHGIKMKTYVIILSKKFPLSHERAGDETLFRDKFLLGIGCPDCDTEQDLSGENISPCNSCERACAYPKIHTIRANYPLWKKRIAEVERGEACLSIRQWAGKPYRSKQSEIVRLTRDDNIGVQELLFDDTDEYYCLTSSGYIPKSVIATNDGLSIEDWGNWINVNDGSSLAIIHFTRFRY